MPKYPNVAITGPTDSLYTRLKDANYGAENFVFFFCVFLVLYCDKNYFVFFQDMDERQ